MVVILYKSILYIVIDLQKIPIIEFRCSLGTLVILVLCICFAIQPEPIPQLYISKVQRVHALFTIYFH